VIGGGPRLRDLRLQREARNLLLKAAGLALPLLILVTAYLVADPFAVLRRPASYYPVGSAAPRNRDFVSTETLLRQPDFRQRDSFILGSSRSLPFSTTDWARHLDAGVRPYHFDASLESLFGVWSKVRYLDRQGVRLKNVLIVADAGCIALVETCDGCLRNLRRRVSERASPAGLEDTAASIPAGVDQPRCSRQ